MVGPPVPPPPVYSPILLVGQAPGPREAGIGRPFAWTAGRQLFRWFATLDVDEATFRSRVYMAATARCFPGKARSGGDRVPSREELAACGAWLDRERELLQPELLIPVGSLAISRFLGKQPLTDVVGRVLRHEGMDVIALPHPSGVSTWTKTEPGATLLQQALALLGRHPVWVRTLGGYGGAPESP